MQRPALEVHLAYIIMYLHGWDPGDRKPWQLDDMATSSVPVAPSSFGSGGDERNLAKLDLVHLKIRNTFE